MSYLETLVRMLPRQRRRYEALRRNALLCSAVLLVTVTLLVLVPPVTVPLQVGLLAINGALLAFWLYRAAYADILLGINADLEAKVAAELKAQR